MKPSSLMRKIEAFFMAAPDEELTMADVEVKFECTFDQATRAVRNLRAEGMTLCFRFGRTPVLRMSEKKSTRGAQIQQRSMRRAQIIVTVAPSVFPEHHRVASASTPVPRVTIRDCDGVRVSTIQPQDTDEAREKERARRAKQKPPKPTRQANTRGKKVRKWDGEDING